MSIPSHHPAIAGHFPGHPVVPGALILEYVFSTSMESYVDVAGIVKLVQVKFIMPILPDQLFHISLDKKDNNRIAFIVTIDDHIFVKGILGYRSSNA